MNVKGKKVTVVGLGRTAIALVRLLVREGAEPFVTEYSDAESLTPFKDELCTLGVPFETGGHTDTAFDGAALIIPSPGVPPRLAPIEAARARGANVIGEIEFSSHFCTSKALAVTGTNGKTTTTELLRALVDACGHSVALAGNNEVPLSAAVLRDPQPEYIVIEVSSYQLETARSFRPWIAAVLNVTPDHLARHGDMDGYAAVKSRLFANQRAGDSAVLNADDERVAAMRVPKEARRLTFSLSGRVDDGLWLRGNEFCEGDAPVALTSDTLLRGRHNYENVCAALTMMRAGGFDWAKTIEGLRQFRGVEHRIEWVDSQNGVDYFNDSKSTNIDSLRVALESFENPVVLIAGGRGKGADYRVLRDLVRSRIKALVTIGEDAPVLEEAFGDLVGVRHATDMGEAVRLAAETATQGDAVLLSPACASFDMYDNFEHRGRVFKDCVRKHLEGCKR
ncbi:MAG: UDP-N-acetylmuramoyl-L-alanine--D-glutamate ligase [Candidatus Hydrogenedentes bacterium]|nr:UDP-N-acetylmuramoyl-L-alanine--D-glutamate ligase [Candidatus Hydrogenedentota bacterium]